MRFDDEIVRAVKHQAALDNTQPKKQYADCYSAESVLCKCIKQILDKVFHIQYPNRNKVVHSVFGMLKTVKK